MSCCDAVIQPQHLARGPHIASVTLAAYECGSVNFPEPPYPDQIICPQEEAGAGTAIGELPPYFMARAARLSGAEPDDEDYEEFEEMLEQAENAQDARPSLNALTAVSAFQALRRGCTTVRSGESKHLHKIVTGFTCPQAPSECMHRAMGLAQTVWRPGAQ
ncbi:hypothetical protein JZ751_023090 [Albula glossodonta]|uniref:Uncharacterized protein n=1 Tax=Albula glossodonta TaxID=121402 RepID=A0A8T2PI26_9TELE|nr:hypothetical protein JZ751_023090 [Albula glossodonta]